MDRTYFPVLLLVGFVIVNAVMMLGLSHLTMRPRPTPVKQTPYESGIPPLGDARERFSVKFYMVAMLFIVFDIETVFMIPWGAYFRQLSCAVPLVDGACPPRPDLVLRPRRDAGLHRHPARRLHLRLEEGSAAMGLSHRAHEPTVSYGPPSQEELGRDAARLPRELGPRELAVADAVRHRLLRDRVHGHRRPAISTSRASAWSA